MQALTPKPAYCYYTKQGLKDNPLVIWAKMGKLFPTLKADSLKKWRNGYAHTLPKTLVGLSVTYANQERGKA